MRDILGKMQSQQGQEGPDLEEFLKRVPERAV